MSINWELEIFAFVEFHYFKPEFAFPFTQASGSEWVEVSEDEDEDGDEDDDSEDECNEDSNSDETDDDNDEEIFYLLYNVHVFFLFFNS